MKNRQVDPLTPPDLSFKWVSIFIFLLLSGIVTILWLTLNKNENEKQQQLLKTEAENLANYLRADMRSRIPALQRMVKRWETRGNIPENEFILDAQSYIEDYPGFQAIEWVDKTFHVRWIIPLSGNEKAKGLNLAFEMKRRIALEKARDRKKPTMTSPINLVQGGKGFLIYFPIYINGKFNGFILAVFRIQEWLDFTFSIRESQEELENFIASVAINKEKVFEQTHYNKSKTNKLSGKSNIDILGNIFNIECYPSKIFDNRYSNILNMIIVIAGYIMSFLIAVTVYLLQKSNIESWKSSLVAESLEIEIKKQKETEEELHEISERLKLATKAGNIGVWIWDITSNYLSWDNIMHEIYDYPVDTVPAYEAWRKSLHPDDLKDTEDLLLRAVHGKAVFDTEFRIIIPGEIIRHIRAAARVERDENGEPIRMTGVNWDITEQKVAEELLTMERRRLADILKGTNVGTWEWYVETGETIFNERWAEIIGYTLNEISPVSIDTWVKYTHPEDLEKSNKLLQKHFSNELDYYEFEARMKHKNGQWIWVLDRGRVSKWSNDGKPLIMSGTHQDITERKNAEEQIKHLATHDALTDLPTLRLAEDRVDMAINAAERNLSKAAIMFIDLDGFKLVNDSYGHDAGDEVLKVVSARLHSKLRKTDTLARIGGDEFLAILPDIKSKDNVSNIAENFIKEISQPIKFKENELNVGCSIGISFYPENGKDVESLIKAADDEMYKIKKSGKNNFSIAGN
ncbi:MAG: sensor domain-containing diguanylate cyclase [Planctomycetota bacterium]|jgi:diguanylate cyclase (GGDEF)-like protein/PAS domain S-box-containing protein